MPTIDLEYYNPKHRNLLNAGAYRLLGTAAKVSKFQTHRKIPLQNFLADYLVHQIDGPQFSTHKDRLNHIGTAASTLAQIMDLNNTIQWRPGSKGQQEWVGEALCLSVANEMFGMTGADWKVIPIQAGKGAQATFDFEYHGVSSANVLIQLEAKGSFVQDNTTNAKPASVATLASNIVKKKKDIVAVGNNYKHPAFARYGMIASIDQTHDAKCYLLDPPGDTPEGDPRHIKVANRLEYLAFYTSLIAPDATFPKALTDQAKSWRTGLYEEDPGALQNEGGHSFSAGNYVEDFFSKGKIRFDSRDIIGQLYVDESGGTFFIGLRGNLIRTAILQNRRAIIDSRYQPSTFRTQLNAEPVYVRNMEKGPRKKKLMTLYCASSGIVIGIPSEDKQ